MVRKKYKKRTRFNPLTKWIGSILICFIFALIPFIYCTPSLVANAQDVWTVQNNNDSGPGSLRQIIDEANGSSSSDKTINFAITGNITPSSILPTLIVNGGSMNILSDSSRGISGLYIQISSGASLTIQNISINNSSWNLGIPAITVMDGNAGNKLLFSGGNAILENQDAGIGVDSGSTLTVDKVPGGTDENCSLIIIGQSYCLGTGGMVNIQGGTINATSADRYGINGIITINGGNVIAYGGYHGSGINGTVTISDGTVKASGYGAGISGTVTISGGTVNSTGGSSGAGIYGTTTISGGIVNVNGNGTAFGFNGTALTISGGTVTFTQIGYVDIYNDICIITGGSVKARIITSGAVDSNGNDVYLVTVTTPLADKAVTCSINGGTSYFPVQTDSEGKLYLWLPETAPGETSSALVLDGTTQYGATGIVTGNYDNTMTAEQSTVTGVDVIPPSAMVQKGLSQQFTAKVIGLHQPLQTVTWSVSNGHGSTAISNSGLLYVSPDETAEILTVTATSIADPSIFVTAAVTVTPPVTVTFDSQGGSPVASQTVEYNGLVIKPDDPTKMGYTFAGWYSDSTFTQQWDFANDKVTSDTTLYAKWNNDSSLITFSILFLLCIPLIALFISLMFVTNMQS